MRDVLCERHPSTAITYNNTGAILRAQGRRVEALENLEKALAIHRDVLGERQPSTGNTYFNMANIHLQLGDMTRARELYSKAHTIFLASYGSEHAHTIMAGKLAMC